VKTNRRNILPLLLVALLAAAAPLRAQVPSAPRGEAGGSADVAPPELQDIGIDEKLGATLPLDTKFLDEEGREVTLRDYFHKDKPVVLQLSYFGCPMLCSLVSQGMVESLNDLSLTMGKEFEVINLSFDASETPQLARKKKVSFLSAYNRPAGGESWHFLTGKPEAIKAITDGTGFRYKWVESVSQFSHPAALILLSPDGKITRYLYGIKYDPKTLRLSLVEASQGKVGSTVDKFLLTCFQYDAHAGKYTPVAMGIMRAGGVAMVLVVAGVIGTLLVRERRHQRETEGGGNGASPPTQQA
jgi:protein SCO1/2